MANWTTLKEAIANVIKTNGNQEITGAVLQNTLNSIVNSVGENATFAGVATPATNPGAPDGKVYYFATQSGTYSNFGNTVVKDGITILFWEPDIPKWVGVLLFEVMQDVSGDSSFAVSQKAVNDALSALTVESADLSSRLDKIEDNINDYFNIRNSLTYSNGNSATNTSFHTTDFIYIINKIINIGTYSWYGLDVPFCVYYDSNFKKIGFEKATEEEGNVFYKEFTLVPPENAVYIKVNAYQKGIKKCYVKIDNDEYIKGDISALKTKTGHNSERITKLNNDSNNKVLSFILEEPITEVLEHKYIVPNLQLEDLIELREHIPSNSRYLSVVKAEVKEGDKVEAKFYQTSAISGLVFTDEFGKVLFTETELNLTKETRYYIAPLKSYYVYTSNYPEEVVLKIYRDRNNSQCVDEIEKLRINQYFYKTEADYEIVEGYFNGEKMTIGETYPLWKKMFTTNRKEQNTCIVPIEDFYTIYYTGRASSIYTRAYYFFDDNDVLLDYRPNNEIESPVKTYINSKIEIPKGAKYVILQSTSVDTYPLSFKIEIPKGEYLDTKIENINNSQSEAIYPLKNKRILMLGDSITEFRNSKNMRISDYFKELSKATVYNCAVGGTQLNRRKLVTDVSEITSYTNAYACLDVVSIIDGFIKKDISLQETAINYLIENTTDNNSKILEVMKTVDLDNIDIITIFAGTNSYASNVNIEDNEEFETVGNLQGAINHIVKQIHTNYPNITIYFFTPIPRMWKVDDVWQWSDNYMPTGNTYKLYELCASIEKAAKRNHVNVCDLYWGLGWNKYNFMNFSNDAKTDGTHPYNGFNRIASKMYHFIVSNLNQI